MARATWVCIAQGFPATPFFVDEDLTRSDGVIRCTHVDQAFVVKYGWRAARALRLLLELPWPI